MGGSGTIDHWLVAAGFEWGQDGSPKVDESLDDAMLENTLRPVLVEKNEQLVLLEERGMMLLSRGSRSRRFDLAVMKLPEAVPVSEALRLEDTREAFDVFDVDGSGTIDHWLVAAGFEWGQNGSMGLAYDVPQQGVQRVP